MRNIRFDHGTQCAIVVVDRFEIQGLYLLYKSWQQQGD
jgi:hypothetical protein